MRELWLYSWLSRASWLNYRAKIMLMAFFGTHVPLIALVAYIAGRSASDWRSYVATLVVALIATLAGTGLTLFVLNHLLRPVVLTSRALRSYKKTRQLSALPTQFGDEVGTLMADATETMVHLEQVLHRVENLDGGTGLPNRRRLTSDLQARVASTHPFTLCAVRFSNYDRVRETLDLNAAERAMVELTGRLQATTGPDLPLYRIGDAHFLLIYGAAGEDHAVQDALGSRIKDLIATCGSGLAFEEVTVEPLLRAGIARYPDDASEPDTLVNHALAAIGTSSTELPVGYHSPASRRAALDRLVLEQDMRRALSRDEFELHYQPVIDLSAGSVCGAEALIRWRHPERGLVPPGTFIGVAEQSGLIDSIGLWVLRQACRQIKAWDADGLGQLKVAINLSARQFLDPTLVLQVREALRDTGIAAERLEIELTETAIMADADYTRAVFSKLRDLGVSIAIDDFGTGYASLSMLRKLPFDKLKIDREFVSEVHATRDSQAICGALVALARGLGLAVLAEGTETAAEVAYLRDRGCSLYQGYYFSKPLPVAAFQANLGQIAHAAAMFGREKERLAEPKLALAG